MITITTTVVYEDGVLRPLDELDLAEHQKVRVTIEPIPSEEEIPSFTFPDEDVPPQNLHALLKEIPSKYITVAYSGVGLMTRAEFMAALNSYEVAHKMSSAEFYQKWFQGEMSDDPEFNMWAGLYKTYLHGELLFKDEVPLEDIVGRLYE